MLRRIALVIAGLFMLSACAAAEEAAVDMMIQVGDHTLTAALVDNASTAALLALLAKGPVTIDMRDYADMEKVGALPESLPRNDEPSTPRRAT